MYIIITKTPELNRAHLIVKGGIYRVYGEKKEKYIVISHKMGTEQRVPKNCCKDIGGKPIFKLSHFAKCIKYIEILKWQFLSDLTNKKLDGSMSTEEHLFSSFKHHSPFCEVFRKFKVDMDTETKYCYCPMKPDKHKEDWPIYRNRINGKKRRHCSMFRNEDGELCHVAEKKMIKRIQRISIDSIVEMLKEIKIPQSLIIKVRGLWFMYVFYKIKKDEIEL
jgi:hypothetical protein